MSLITVAVDGFCVPAFCLIFAPLKGYDEPEILLSQLAQFCLIGADAGHPRRALDKPEARHSQRLINILEADLDLLPDRDGAAIEVDHPRS